MYIDFARREQEDLEWDNMRRDRQERYTTVSVTLTVEELQRLEYIASVIAPDLSVGRTIDIFCEEAIQAALEKAWKRGPHKASGGFVYVSVDGEKYRLHDTENPTKPKAKNNAQKKAALLNERYNNAQFEQYMNGESNV